MTDSTNPNAWRDLIRVHPAADMLPMMSDAELDELAADIAEHGLRVPIVESDDRELLDGRNRLAAIWRIKDPARRNELLSDIRSNSSENVNWQPRDVKDPVAYVLSMNVHRRHLTAEQKREVIAKVLRERPGDSDRAIGRMVKADNKTVASVRAELERREELPHVTTRTDTKGRQQPARKPSPTPTAAAVTEGAPTAPEEESEENFMDALTKRAAEILLRELGTDTARELLDGLGRFGDKTQIWWAVGEELELLLDQQLATANVVPAQPIAGSAR